MDNTNQNMGQEGKKSSLKWVIIIMIIVAGIAVWKYWGGSDKKVVVEQEIQVSEQNESSIYIADQKPGRFVNVRSAVLGVNGYVTIHEDNNGEMGDAIGNSALLNTGKHENFSVTLDRKSVDEEYLYGMLHADNDNGVYDAADATIKDKNGNDIMVKFKISVNASEPVEYKM